MSLSLSLQTQPTSLSQYVQEYSVIDEELQELSAKQKILRDRKTELQTIIIQTMKDRNLENRTMKQGDHHYCIGTRKQYSSLTFSYLESVFEKMIPDKTNRNFLLQYLRENREVKTVDELKKTTIKPL
jgi:hypothetical protein